jgi:Trk K+ transport system NAD-binding subunit
MKFLPSQLAYLLGERETRQNLRALLSYLALLLATIVVYSLLFHVIMVYEGQAHSWLTGFYWTLTVMSTLGFGDITFQSDLGRAFSILVLLSGIVMLLIVLPFTFIRFFYAPWLEAQLRLRAPRRCAEHERDHVILCAHDEVGRGLIPRLEQHGIAYQVIEPDPAVAAGLHADGVSVVTGSAAERETFQNVNVATARAVFTSLDDATNTNVALTVREVTNDVPIVAIAEDEHSVDVLELSGATHVLDLKYRLGEHLASRVSLGAPQAHRIGRFEDLVIAEFPLHATTLVNRSVRDTRLRELTGVSIVAVWQRGRLLPATPDTLLTEHSVPVIVGTEDQMTALDGLFVIYDSSDSPVVVIGGGKVGCAAARALREREISVVILDRNPDLRPRLEEVADRVVIGDAADISVVTDAGVGIAPSVVLTTNNDAANIFLAVYCRRLNPDAHVVSRITHEWNLEAIHRAGADFALSFTSLAVQSVLSIVLRRDLVVVGGAMEIFVEQVPPALAGKTLAESGIGAETGLNVIAVRSEGGSATNPAATIELSQGAEIVMLGTPEQRESFARLFDGRQAKTRLRGSRLSVP